MRAYLDETHVWYELSLETERPRKSLAPEFTLVRGTPDDIPLLDELPTVNERAARQRLKDGNDLWLVLEDRRPAFACWIFNDSMPVVAARGGQLRFPPEIVCLEDSVTSASYRGRGVAPAAWSEIADKLEQTGVRSIITKIEVSNVPSRRAVAKSGFREIATMHFRRIGPREHTTVEAENGAVADWLAKQLRK